MVQQDIQLRSGEANSKRFLNPDVDDCQPESISRCALRFQNKKMDECSKRQLDELYQLLAQARN